MPNIGINEDDQKKIRAFKDEFAIRYEGRGYVDRKGKIDLVADMLKWSLAYLHDKLGLDGYVHIESDMKQKKVAGLIIPGAAEEVFYPVVTVTGRLDKREQAYLEKGVDIERKVFDAQRNSSKQMKEKGWDTDLLQ